MPRDGHAPEAILDDQFLSLLIKTWRQVVYHATDEEAVWILPHHLLQIVILQSVDKLLHDHRSTHLRIVHIRQEHLCSVMTVNHKRR